MKEIMVRIYPDNTESVNGIYKETIHTTAITT